MTIQQLFTDYWAVIMVIGGMIWWASGINTKIKGFNHRFDTIDKKFDAIDKKFDTIDKKFDTINGEFKDIKKSIGIIEKSIEVISTNIRKNEVSASKSPSQLNEHGIKISEGINGKEFVKKHLNAINYNNEMNEYQIQQACFDYTQSELIDKISIEERKALEMVAYNQGASIQTVLTVLGFDLRDAKFKELGIDTAVIDKHKP